MGRWASARDLSQITWVLRSGWASVCQPSPIGTFQNMAPSSDPVGVPSAPLGPRAVRGRSRFSLLGTGYQIGLQPGISCSHPLGCRERVICPQGCCCPRLCLLAPSFLLRLLLALSGSSTEDGWGSGWRGCSTWHQAGVQRAATPRRSRPLWEHRSSLPRVAEAPDLGPLGDAPLLCPPPHAHACAHTRHPHLA